MDAERISMVERASESLVAAGYPYIEFERRGAAGSKSVVADLVAWGAGPDGEFLPQVSVEIVANALDDPGRRELVLATLSGSAASMGTATNLVYSGSEWLQADSGFLSLSPVGSPPKPAASAGLLTDSEVVRRLIGSKLWRSAEQARGLVPVDSWDGPLRALADVQLDETGHVRGLVQGAITPGPLFAREWLQAVGQLTRTAGEHLTPLGVSEAMANLADVGPGEQVYDPFAGFGGTLIAAGSCADVDPPARVLGSELNAEVQRGAEQLLNLAAVVGSIQLQDSTRQAWPQSDVIISVPPLAVTLPEFVDLPFGRTRNLEVAAIAWAAEALNVNGRAVLLTSRSWTYRSRDAAELRKWIAESFHVAALIGLPAVHPGTQIPMLLTVIDRKSPGSTVIADLGEDWAELLAPRSEIIGKLQRAR